MKRTVGWMLVALLIGGGLGAAAQVPATVLDVEPGVSLLGAGGAGLSIPNGAETLYYNPAALSQLPGISFSSFYASHFGLASYSAFSLTFRNFGAAVMLLNSGGIQGYDADGTQTEALGFGNTAFMFGAGLTPSDLTFLPDLGFNFALGARIKGVTASIGEVTGSGFAVDLGFWSELSDMRFGSITVSEISVAVTVVNMFGALTYDATQETFGMDIQIGASALFLGTVRAALDLRLAGSTHFGLSYSPMPTFVVRLGIMSKDALSVTAGLGINVEGFLIDYAFVTHTLGVSHRISLTLDFSALDIGALSRSLRRLLP